MVPRAFVCARVHTCVLSSTLSAAKRSGAQSRASYGLVLIFIAFQAPAAPSRSLAGSSDHIYHGTRPFSSHARII